MDGVVKTNRRATRAQAAQDLHKKSQNIKLKTSIKQKTKKNIPKLYDPC